MLLKNSRARTLEVLSNRCSNSQVWNARNSGNSRERRIFVWITSGLCENYVTCVLIAFLTNLLGNLTFFPAGPVLSTIPTIDESNGLDRNRRKEATNWSVGYAADMLSFLTRKYAHSVASAALQGAFTEHINLLNRLPDVAAAPQIKTAAQLADATLDALILPGGESTTMALVAERSGLMEPLRKWVNSGKPVWVCNNEGDPRESLFIIGRSSYRERVLE